MRKINIGIIGCGQWGLNYVRIFNQLPQTKVLVCADTDANKLKYLKSLYESIEITSDYRDILKDKRIEAVCIATPADSHFKIAKEAMKFKKHILVEKPLTTNIADAEKLMEIFDEEIVVMVGHIFKYNPAIIKLKEYIFSNKIGKIYYIHSIRTNLGPVRHDVNVMWDLFPHDISIFLFLLDSFPLEVSALGKNYLRKNFEDVVFITLQFPENTITNSRISWLDPRKIREITVVGSKKMVVFDDLNNIEPLKIFDKGIEQVKNYETFGEFQFLLRDGDILIPKIKMLEPLKNQCEHFIKCIKENKRPLTDIYEGIKVVRILDAAEKSLKKRGAPVKIK